MTLDGRVHFVVRTLQSPGLDGAFRVHVLQDHLEDVGLKNGDLCEITDAEDCALLLGYGIAWRATDRMGNAPKVRPAKTTDVLRNAFGIKEGSHVNLSRTKGKIVKADKIVLTDVTPEEYSANNGRDVEDEKWWVRCAYMLMNCEAFASGHTFDVSAKKGIRKRFYIEHVEAAGMQQGTPNLFYCNDHTKVVFADPATSRPSSAVNGESGAALTAEHIGGLAQQLQELNRCMKRVLKQSKEMPRFLVNEGILIHGYEGTGKSLLLKRLEYAGFQKVFHLDKSKVDAGTTAKTRLAIESVFNRAAENQPSLVLMDDLEELAPSTDDVFGSTIAAELDKLTGSHIQVVAACRAPNQIKKQLIGPGRLPLLIELPIPDLEARRGILSVMLDKADDPEGKIANNVSLRTHGFTGKDLGWLVHTAYRNALNRYEEQQEKWVRGLSVNGSLEKRLDGAVHSQAAAQIEGERNTLGDESEVNGMLELNVVDFDIALTQVGPTALREIFFEKPQVKWSDIGGSHAIKERFDRIIGQPLHKSERMQRLSLRPRKGVLLYGPPGCSKTLTAQAVATNYDLNFIAVKGAELISMYVGESERAIREIFRKARTAAPCVIFFDEIDSIASERESGGTKGLNVLTTLLNEMDGFQALKGVIVLAATNKPDILDPAIMRPGRFDSHIYLGPPDEAARKEIFAIQTNGIPVEGKLDMDKLVKATEGYSGAEIVNICDLAKEEALERPETETSENDDGVRMADLEEAIKRTRKGITARILSTYEAFAEKESV